MKRRSAKTPWIVLAAWALVGTGASAQSMYRCNSGAGAYLSDRPCASASTSAPTTVLGSYGPVREAPARSTGYSPTMAKAPDFLRYMSVACAEMSEALRTGPTRGLKSAAMSELHANYRVQCAEDEQQAHRKLGEVRSDERQQKQTAQAAQRAEQAQARMTVDQCNEMLRILAGKRQRVATMTAGERADMDLFESNYRLRCKG